VKLRSSIRLRTWGLSSSSHSHQSGHVRLGSSPPSVSQLCPTLGMSSERRVHPCRVPFVCSIPLLDRPLGMIYHHTGGCDAEDEACGHA
jgi:hypothetical protein